MNLRGEDMIDRLTTKKITVLAYKIHHLKSCISSELIAHSSYYVSAEGVKFNFGDHFSQLISRELS